MTDEQAKLVCVFGCRGSGKSTVAKALVKDRPKVIVFDVMGEYTGGKFVRCNTLSEVKDAMRARWSEGFQISYVPPNGTYHVEALHELALLVWQVQATYEDGRDSRMLTLVIEEAHMGFPNTQLPRDQQGMVQLVTLGRHRGIEGIAITQRPALLNTVYRSCAPQSYIFALDHEDDQASVVKTVGREHAEAVRTMPDFNFLLRERGSVRMGKTAKTGRITIKK